MMKTREFLLVFAGLASVSIAHAGRKDRRCAIQSDQQGRCLLSHEERRQVWVEADESIQPWAASENHAFIAIPGTFCNIIHGIANGGIAHCPPYAPEFLYWVPQPIFNRFKKYCSEASTTSDALEEALFHAVQFNNIELASILMKIPDIRIDVHKTVMWTTILHYAVDAGLPMLKLLCESGKITAKLMSGKTSDGVSVLARTLSATGGLEILEYLFDLDFEDEHCCNAIEQMMRRIPGRGSILCTGITAERPPNCDAFRFILEELCATTVEGFDWDSVNEAIRLAKSYNYTELSELLESYNNL